MGFGIKRRIEHYFNEINWRKKNRSNFTKIKDGYNMDCITIGKNTYGEISCLATRKTNKLFIGAYCSIADNVTFVLCADHNIGLISTYPFQAKLFGHDIDATSKGDIIVDDDVWIGYGATIMSGVHIGQGAVVAAGAVVTKDVPPYAIVGGVPAKVIKYRFEPEMIKELLKIDYSKLSKEDIEKHIDDLYTELKDPSQLDWMPKKV